MNELVTVRNKLNGGIAKVKRSIAVHEYFGQNLEIVPDGTKPKVSLSTLVAKSKPKPAPSKPEAEQPKLDLEGDDK